MRILILFNPIAGKGKSRAVARRVDERLRAAGHETVVAETRVGACTHWLDGLLTEVDGLVVAGGDGAMRLACDPAGRTSTPIYQIPCGTENLFAREFGMSRSPRALLEALQQFTIGRADTGLVGDQPFLHMVSMGYDAAVVHDLARRRGRSISHASYLRPMVRQLLRWEAPRLLVVVDGEPIGEPQAGCVIVANSRQYAGRLDPAWKASITDSRLDVVFLPTRSRLDLIGWIVKCRLRRQRRDPRLLYRQGREVEIHCEPPQLFQVDGDPPGGEGAAASRLEITLRPAFLPVLQPARRRQARTGFFNV